MAPNIPSRAPKRAPAQKAKTVISTSTMFKKTARSFRTSQPTSSTTSTFSGKSRSLQKHASKPRSTLTSKSTARVQKELEHPLSTAFNEASRNYQTTVVSEANAALDSTLQSLLTRLDEPTPQGLEKDEEDSNRLPTTAELQSSHNRLIKDLTLPIEYELLTYPDPVTGHSEKSLGELMKGFSIDIKRAEKKEQELMKEWRSIQGEIKDLSIEIMGPAATEALIKGNTTKTVPEELMPSMGLDTKKIDGFLKELGAIKELGFKVEAERKKLDSEDNTEKFIAELRQRLKSQGL
ncbi:uncharacterized protein K452DRAFT_332256 [Aplosporella prunicola CBS 121167]|uniref:Uncharacterized protein n=1 Tax=Aplosporella prunicola CBS 121167 TaxID=1176127 RepID=A0A6A6BI30_9PEZI|nr:uncharacterized protein K452DRAFT_332256 [Aplosporella prunicola CBS 121167]KAF2142507.1 hypothetical protein K452DRAFT_332256 [Aplosporella prunicola CBS 121167]